MILYFSGSGNSQFAAECIAQKIHEPAESLNHLMKTESGGKFQSSSPYIIVTPIYAWRIPGQVLSWLEKSSFSGSRKIYFVATMGADSGQAEKYCRRFAEEKNMEYMGFCGIAMPDNYIYGYDCPDPEEAARIIKRALPQLNMLSQSLLSGLPIERTDHSSLAFLKSAVVNPLFRKFMNTSRDFTVNASCIGCRTCEKLCPMNNITVVNGRPSFGSSCMTCYSCIHHCPKQAINIKGKTEKKRRYLCPTYSEFMAGQPNQ